MFHHILDLRFVAGVGRGAGVPGDELVEVGFERDTRLGVKRRLGTNPGTGTAYVPTALPTVASYTLPGSGFVPGDELVEGGVERDARLGVECRRDGVALCEKGTTSGP